MPAAARWSRRLGRGACRTRWRSTTENPTHLQAAIADLNSESVNGAGDHEEPASGGTVKTFND